MSGRDLDFADYLALVQLYADYAQRGRLRRLGPLARVLHRRLRATACVPRENHERGFPLATLSFESKGMLKDRVYGIRETLFHDPYYQRHVVSAPLVREVEDGPHRLRGELRGVPDQARRSYDGLQRRPLPRRRGAHARRPEVPVAPVIYDSEMIPNSIIYPI